MAVEAGHDASVAYGVLYPMLSLFAHASPWSI